MSARSVPTREDWETNQFKQRKFAGQQIISEAETVDHDTYTNPVLRRGAVTLRPDDRFDAHARLGLLGHEIGSDEESVNWVNDVDGPAKGYRTRYRAQVAADAIRNRLL